MDIMHERVKRMPTYRIIVVVFVKALLCIIFMRHTIQYDTTILPPYYQLRLAVP